MVNIKVLGPSSEDSSIPSSYEKDFKMKKISTNKGKENFQLLPTQDSAENESLNIIVGEINIPALKKLGEGRNQDTFVVSYFIICTNPSNRTTYDYFQRL